MAIPVTTATVVGGPLSLTASQTTPSVTVTDTGDPYTPAATARSVRVNATTVNATAPVTSTVGFIAPGTYPVSVNVVNADGTATSAVTNVAVTDSLSSLALIPGTSRIRPTELPLEYRDPTIATPGIPTAQNLYYARRSGSILTDADRGNVVVNGAPQKVALA